VESQPFCRKAFELDGSNHAPAVNLGHTYLLIGDEKTAETYYRKSLVLIPNRDALLQGPVADFDLFIKKGWQKEAAERWKAWFTENWAKTGR
jgi:hypothetical protein